MANETMPVPVNISLDEDWKEASEGGSRRESTFNEKNYLNVRLEKGEKEKSYASGFCRWTLRAALRSYTYISTMSR